MSFFLSCEQLADSPDPETAKVRIVGLRTRLLELQSRLKEADFPVLILISGVDGAGKGESLNLLNEWMDPRYLQTFAFGPRTDEELQRPEYWRFWRSLPAKGRIGLYMGSWYSDPIALRLKGDISRREWLLRLERIGQFEQMLVEDGALVIKIWLHLSKQDQIERMNTLSADPATAWRVTEQEWQHLRIYDRFRQLAGETLELTSQPAAPWQVINGQDPMVRGIALAERVGERIAERLAGRFDNIGHEPLPVTGPSSATRNGGPEKQLQMLRPGRRLQKADYRQQLELQQGRLNRLSREARNRGIASVLLLEGWDAAGKGGIIRRIIPAMDARHYRVIPVAAPSAEERRYHYLWRFWRDLPAAGRTAIFDRSWYGRVLVERVEELSSEAEWQRAYDEIRDFERQLTDYGIVLVKYWVHISEAEQLSRFRHREQTPHKQFKITEEDYRNRQRWSDYEAAVNEMVARTGTDSAPWLLIEGNNKRYARIKALKGFCERLEAALQVGVINL